MALFGRRRKKEDANPAPRQSDSANPVPAAAGPEDWRPKRMSQTTNVAPALPNRRDTWVPEGVVPLPPGQRRARSNPSLPAIDIPSEDKPDAPPVEPPRAEPPPPPRAEPPPPPRAEPPLPIVEAPPADRGELHSRIASLEDQIAAAKASRSSEQDATIRALQLRLAAFEEELAKSSPGHARPAAPGATTLRILAVIALFIVIAGSPLFMSRRTICHVHGKPQTHWSIVKPFDDSGPPRCDNQLGGSVLVDSLGLK